MNLAFKLSIITLFSCILALPLQTHAQIPTSIDGINIQASTDSPRPGQSIEVSIESFNINLNSASIVWLSDGKNIGEGVGLKKIAITAPKIGVANNITAVIKPSNAPEIRKVIKIKTGSVDILWETDGYKPPFFKGKVPFVYQNKIKLIAIPHLSKTGVSEIDPKTLVYSWKIGGKYVEGGQGYGKQSIEIGAQDIPKPLEISVEVYNREETERTIGYITLEPTEPSLSFYEEDALYGILFSKALTENVTLKHSEMRILAVPYGFNINNNTYAWSVNDIEQADLVKNRSITVRGKGGNEGNSLIGLGIRNDVNILQGIRGSFNVYFSGKETPSEVLNL